MRGGTSDLATHFFSRDEVTGVQDQLIGRASKNFRTFYLRSWLHAWPPCRIKPPLNTN